MRATIKNIVDYHYSSRIYDFNGNPHHADLNQDIGYNKTDLCTHMEQFKAVLKNIELIEGFSNTPEVKESTIKFCYSDCKNLLSYTDRSEYVDSISRISESHLNKLRSSAEIFSNNDTTSRINELREKVHSSTFYDLTGHTKSYLDTNIFLESSHYKETVGKLSTYLLYKNKLDVDEFVFYTEHNEDLMLVIAEPNLCGILGCTLLFSIILPIHKTGVFYHMMTDVKFVLTYYFSYKGFIHTTLSHIKNYSQIVLKKPMLSITIGLGSFYSFKMIGSTFLHLKESTIAQNFVKKAFSDGGFDSKYLNDFNELLAKTCYEIGNTISTITFSFARGVFKKYEGLLTDLAPYIDKYITGSKK